MHGLLQTRQKCGIFCFHTITELINADKSNMTYQSIPVVALYQHSSVGERECGRPRTYLVCASCRRWHRSCSLTTGLHATESTEGKAQVTERERGSPMRWLKGRVRRKQRAKGRGRRDGCVRSTRCRSRCTTQWRQGTGRHQETSGQQTECWGSSLREESETQ